MSARRAVVGLALACAAVQQCDAQPPAPIGRGWRYQGVRFGVTTHSKPSASGHLIFHGATDAAGYHIADLMAVCLDDEHATEWVDKLLEKRVGKWSGRPTSAAWGTRVYEDLLLQLFDGPWPVADRELLMHRVISLTPGNRTARIAFYDAGNVAGYPPDPRHVRGWAESIFEFVAHPTEKRTRIMLTGYVDPKGRLPTAFVNLINRDWAANTISGLLRRVMSTEKRRGPPGPMQSGVAKGADLSGWGGQSVSARVASNESAWGRLSSMFAPPPPPPPPPLPRRRRGWFGGGRTQAVSAPSHTEL